jgi:aspartyl protease family protein
VALTRQDAIKLGFKPDALNYTRKYNTANGVSYAAPVVIKELTIHKKTFYNVEAHVASAGLDISLLGMSLIEDFANFKITKDMLILEY